MRLRPLDFLVILASLVAIALTSASVYSRRGAALEVLVSSPSGEWIFPIGSERRFAAPGRLGPTWIVIAGKSARIESSPCPNKTCIAAGSIAEAGQWLACLPNEVFVRVEGEAEEGAVDAGAY
jgi:hypothetical protein